MIRSKKALSMILSALILGLAQASAPAQASTPAQPRAATTAPRPDNFFARLRQRGVSEAGVQILQQSAARRSAEVQRSRTALAAVAGEVRTLAAAPNADVARLGDALRRRDAARASLAALQTAVTVESLQALSPADRAIFIRSLGLAGRPNRPAPNAPPARPPQPRQ